MKWNQLKKWLLMAVLQAGTIFFYFWGVRPLRGWHSEWVGSVLFRFQSEAAGYVESVERTGITIDTTYVFQGTELVFSYAPQFGFFFLIAVLGLNFLLPRFTIYLLLTGFHFLVEICSLGFSLIAFNGYPVGFVIADFLLLYLSPLMSLGFILVVILRRKGKI